MKLFLLLFFLSPLFIVAQITGKVVGITDGDTFTFLKQDSTTIKVRFHGIDCPENGQSFSAVCKKYLSDLIYSKKVTLLEKGLDRYGRTLAIVLIDTINVNEKMIFEGLAWHFKQYDSNPKWTELEKNAKNERKGLWKDNNPIPPWEWRRNN